MSVNGGPELRLGRVQGGWLGGRLRRGRRGVGKLKGDTAEKTILIGAESESGSDGRTVARGRGRLGGDDVDDFVLLRRRNLGSRLSRGFFDRDGQRFLLCRLVDNGSKLPPGEVFDNLSKGGIGQVIGRGCNLKGGVAYAVQANSIQIQCRLRSGLGGFDDLDGGFLKGRSVLNGRFRGNVVWCGEVRGLGGQSGFAARPAAR